MYKMTNTDVGDFYVQSISMIDAPMSKYGSIFGKTCRKRITHMRKQKL